MKVMNKIVVALLAVVLVISLVPVMQLPAQAASTPVLVLSATTAVNPILSHHLDFDKYSTGGPFTVSFEWKGSLKPNDPSDVKGCHGLVNVTGTIYGSSTKQEDAGFEGYNPPSLPSGNTEWSKHTFQFQNVGTYPMTGTNKPGNILRFGLWKAKGSMYIKNVRITNAAGEVMYDLNTDSVVAQAVANTEALGLESCDMSELAAIDYEHCPWVPGQFSTGQYSSTLTYESDGKPVTTTPTTGITKPTTTKPTTAPVTTVTTQPTTAPVDPTDPTDPINPTDPVVPTDPTDPTTIPTTAAPTTAPAPTTQPGGEGEGNQDGGSKINPVVLIVAGVALVAVIAGAVVYFAVLKKKKQ